MTTLNKRQTLNKSQSNKMVWLLIGLPVASVAMGLVTLVLALKTTDSLVTIEEEPLSKTSWSEDL